jgi:hypothetical protein
MTAYMITHNMIIEAERDDSIHDQGWDFQGELVDPKSVVVSWKQFMHVTDTLHD